MVVPAGGLLLLGAGGGGIAPTEGLRSVATCGAGNGETAVAVRCKEGVSSAATIAAAAGPEIPGKHP